MNPSTIFTSGATRTAGPERPELSLELGESDDVRPGTAVQDGADGCTVNASSTGGLTEAGALHGGTEVEGELASDLGVGVVGLNVRPVIAELGGNRAGRTGAHAPSLASFTETPDLRMSAVPLKLNGDIYRRFLEGVIVELDNFAPVNNGADWETVRAFVKDAVILASSRTTYPISRLFQVITAHTIWCTSGQGLPLDPQVIFIPRVIDAFCLQASDNEATQGTYRSSLLTVSRALYPDLHAEPLTPMHKRQIQPPYSIADLELWRGWAKGQRTLLHREKASLLLGFGLGAGLTPIEIARVARKHVHVDDQGVLVEVVGRNARGVPVLREWERNLTKVAKTREAEQPMWGNHWRRDSRNLLSSFTSVAAGTAPNYARLRGTWLVTHLQRGTPMLELFRAGGLKHFSNLNQYLQYVEPTGDDEFRKLLRGGKK
jgi:hypothetical protein